MDNKMRTVLRSLVQHIHPGQWETINFNALILATGLSEEGLTSVLQHLQKKNYIELKSFREHPEFRIKLDDKGHTIPLDENL